MFLGPSLSHVEARDVLDADYHPPVKRGDLSGIPDDVTIVGIVDGVLLSDAAVGHREILQLMRRGVTVIGGGSMGALRAAELNVLGMVGVGRIYEEYSSGRIDGDDEVVLMFDPFTLNALSEPLINLRLNVERAVSEGIIDSSSADLIMNRLKDTFYPERSYDALISISGEILSHDIGREFEGFIRSKSLDFKRKDAIDVIKAIKSCLID